MKLHRTGVLSVVASVVSSAEASMPLNDPKICYILDGLLILYSIIMTALFFRTRFGNQKAGHKEEAIYSDLNRAPDTYDQLRSHNDPEGGTMRRQNAEGLYMPLQKQTEEPYREIGVKKERRRNKPEQVYQGLTGATRDTYDALQMQPLPPR